MSWLKLAVIGAVLAGGCVGEELELSGTEQALKNNPGADGDECPPWACGSNSPVIDFAGFHELNRSGLVNAEGFKITAFRRLIAGVWQPFYADVVNASLVAKNASGAVVYSGSGVKGMLFTIVQGSSTYYMKVEDVARTVLWANIGGITRVTPTYRLTWSTSPAAGFGARPVCGVSNDPDGIANYYAVLFETDRIDADAIKVTGDVSGWFNIGCAGHALAKQHLTGNTRAAAAIMGASVPSLNQRTANLKMISGDYCGGGDPFTVPGVPLHYKDVLGRMNNLESYTHLEARWNETGAICLNTPRIDYTWTPAGSGTFPSGVETLLVAPPIGQWCTGVYPAKLRPPPCTDLNLSNFQGGYVISVEE